MAHLAIGRQCRYTAEPSPHLSINRIAVTQRHPFATSGGVADAVLPGHHDVRVARVSGDALVHLLGVTLQPLQEVAIDQIQRTGQLLLAVAVVHVHVHVHVQIMS